MVASVVDIQRKEVTGSLSMQVVRVRVVNSGDYFASRFEQIDGVTASIENSVGNSDYSIAFPAAPNIILISPDVVPIYVNLMIFGR